MTERTMVLWIQRTRRMGEDPGALIHAGSKLMHGSKQSVALIVTACLALTSMQVGRAADPPQPDMQQAGQTAPRSWKPTGGCSTIQPSKVSPSRRP